MVGFSGILDTGQVEDQKMIKEKLIYRKKFWVKMIRDAGSKCDDSSVSPKIRQILLHWVQIQNQIQKENQNLMLN